MVSAVPLALWVAVPCVPCGCVLSAPLCDGLGMCLRCGCVPCEGVFRCALCVRCPVWYLAAVWLAVPCVVWAVLCAALCGIGEWRCARPCASLCPMARRAYGRAVLVAVCGCEPVFCVPWLCGCAAVCSACG
ncbi:hypothetical protein PBI_GABRIELA_143 [Mycobacterium phage Gabriela]|nr:hypothetical protein PBI_GABRIELA_143 [Mycobacterium phage Gabriela]